MINRLRKEINAGLLLVTMFVLVACGGSYSGSPDAGGGGVTPLCGSTGQSSYTVTWDAVTDVDLSGYKIYYGTSSGLTKNNAIGRIDSTVNSIQFKPADYNINVCDTLYLAVSAVGSTKSESSLSTIVVIVIKD